MFTLGIILAFVAMLFWGFGDFLIQKSTRKVGDLETLFVLTTIGALLILPFVWKEVLNIHLLDFSQIILLVVTSIILLAAALLDFEALKKGKLSVVEPIWSLEIPTAAFLAYFILGEKIEFSQIFIIITLIICLILVSLKNRHVSVSILLEKGVFLAVIAAIFMGTTNYFMGWSGRETSPLMVNFFTDVFIAIVIGIVLLVQNRFKSTFVDFRNNYILLVPMSIADNAAWVAFVYGMTYAPIAIITALSESYIIVAVMLGLFINKERIHFHQKIGLTGAVMAAILLSVISV